MDKKAKKILCFTGNSCVDRLIWHHGDRTKPTRIRMQVGGKGADAARELSYLGMESTHLMAWEPKYDYLAVREPYRTVTVNVEKPIRVLPNYIDLSAGETYLDYANTNEVSEEEAAAVLTEYKKLLEEGQDFVIMGGSACRGMEDVYPAMVKLAKEKGVPVILDSHGPAFSKSLGEKPDYITPNADEVNAEIGGTDRGSIAENARILLERGAGTAIITRGEKGLIYVTQESKREYEAVPVRCINPIGSGDSFNAYFVYGLLMGFSADTCIRLGMAAGAVNAASANIARVRPEQVNRLIERKRLPLEKIKLP